ncbi:hypothetical protein [Citrobacter freundii]|uniref:hypothetical protein n=1 Tax=Citrobacter freundii TaxID=546 RepID=UPI001EF1422A|nr:hypothetical protein [Citrobacter freundii]
MAKHDQSKKPHNRKIGEVLYHRRRRDQLQVPKNGSITSSDGDIVDFDSTGSIPTKGVKEVTSSGKKIIKY